jgi:hypothetical protein
LSVLAAVHITAKVAFRREARTKNWLLDVAALVPRRTQNVPSFPRWVTTFTSRVRRLDREPAGPDRGGRLARSCARGRIPSYRHVRRCA